MAWKALTHFFLLATIACLCAGKLRLKPRDTDAKLNHTTYFNCSTDIVSSDIFWFHGNNSIYAGYVILEPYQERFRVDRRTWNGTYINNLVIHSVQIGDAGEYICADDEGIGEKFSVQLVVFESNQTRNIIIISVVMAVVVTLLVVLAFTCVFRLRIAKYCVERGLPEKYKSEPAVMLGTKAAQIGCKNIYGLTILDKELFVLSVRSSEMEVYDSMKLSFIRRFNLVELKDSQEIASCSRNKCLYIIHLYDRFYEKSDEILRVDPSGKLIKRWPKDIGYSLSVSYESNVILTNHHRNKLVEYSPDGQLIREINLADVSIHYPSHAIKLTNGHFVVSHGFLKRNPNLHRVCIVDADGNLMKSFGGERGSSIGQLNSPVYLSVDANGFVLVADAVNCRVLLLDSNLKFKRELLTKEKHGLHLPFKFLLDESTNRVFVTKFDYRESLKIFQF